MDKDRENMDLENDALPEDALPLCPNCLQPCHPLDNYCNKCGSSDIINPLASYMPFVDLRFRIGMIGTLWHKSCSGEAGAIFRIVSLALLMLFYPFIIVIGLPVMLIEQFKSDNKQQKQEEE